MYLKESLLKLNQSYDHDHRLNDKDILMANAYKNLIEASRVNLWPVAGDILINTKGESLHIDSVEGHGWSVSARMTTVEMAYVPFVSVKSTDSNPSISLNTSGGPWNSVPVSRLKKLEGFATRDKQLKTFCFFGHCGRCANGAVHFQARVNIFHEDPEAYRLELLEDLEKSETPNYNGPSSQYIKSEIERLERLKIEIYILTRDGKELFRGSELECCRHLHRIQGQSIDWAIKYEGYNLELIK